MYNSSQTKNKMSENVRAALSEAIKRLAEQVKKLREFIRRQRIKRRIRILRTRFRKQEKLLKQKDE